MRHVAYCFALLVAAVSAFGQVGGTGSIQGTVTDPSGAVVAGATITATNLATGVKTERNTTDAGFFVLSLLPAGEYTVTVTAAGFPDAHAGARRRGCARDRGIGRQAADRTANSVRHRGGSALDAEDGRRRAGRARSRTMSTIPCRWR